LNKRYLFENMFKSILSCIFVFFILSIPLVGIGEVPFPDSLYIPRPGVTNNRACGTSLPIPPQGTLLWADIEGPGILRHFWMTNEKVKTEQAIADGKVTIRFYFDGSKEPDLELPLKEFFGKKFTDAEEISWRRDRKSKSANYTMPFRKSVKLELKNNTDERLNEIYWQIDYEKVPEIPEDVKYFDLNTRVSKPAGLDSSAKANKHVKGKQYLKPNSTLVVTKIKGPSIIRRIQMSDNEKETILANRGVIIKIFWDDEKNPSVEAPLGDFFGVGFGENGDFSSQAWVRKKGTRQIFFPMAFRKSARIELVNLTSKKLGKFSWKIDYENNAGIPEDAEYFHSSFRISRPVPLNSVHRAMETSGRGKFVGLVWNHHWINKGMHAEGTQNFWIDGEHIQATGSEDFFGQAWGFYKGISHPYMGNSFGPEKSYGDDVGEWYRLTAFRALLLDPIHFQKSLKLDLTCYGVDVGHKTDEYSTACFWYQSEPHTAFYPLPPAEDLYPIDFPQSYAFGMWQIYELEREHQFTKAINKIEGLLICYPQNPKGADLVFKKGYLLEEQSNIDAALAIYREVKTRFPDSEFRLDAEDKIWLFEKPGRMLLKMASPSGWDAFLDGREIRVDESLFQNMPAWGVDKIYRFTWGPYKVLWNDKSSIIMRLPTIRLEPGSGEHILAVKAMTKKDAPIFSPKLGYLFAVIDIVGPDIVTDNSWKLSAVETEGWGNEVFKDNEWTTSTVYKLDEYPDSTWTWLWPRTFRNFPAHVERIWDENVKMNANKEFKQTLYFRKKIRIPFSSQKSENEYRVLFLGDSALPGDKSNNEEDLPATLQKYMRQYYANKQINVINAGAEGYSFSQEYDFMEKRGLNLSPDLVLYVFLLNMLKEQKEFENNLLLVKKICDQHNITFTVIIIPSAGQVVYKRGSLKSQEQLEKFLQENDFKYFDLANDFSNHPNAASLFLPREENLLSTEGFDLAGKVLAGNLKSIVNPLLGNAFAVSRMKFYETDTDFEGGEYLQTSWQSPKGISLQNTGEDYPTSGSYSSSPFDAPFPMSEILPTWNVDRPTSTGFAVYFQVSEDGHSWSEWLFLGRDGSTPKSLNKTLHTTGAVVDVDFMLLTKDFKYFKWRIDLFTQIPGSSPILRRFAVCYGNSSGDEEIFKNFSGKITVPKGWARKLEMPYYSQLTPEKDIPESMRYSICCPTSLRMVLEYYGVKRSARELCDLNLDPEYQIWGGWPKSAQTLYSFGFRSYVTQIRSFDEIKSWIARGIPLIISIRAKKGELQSAPYPEVGGHVLVISGLTEDGHVWMEDPYNTDGKMGSRLWTRKEIEKTLIGTGGVVVIAEPPSGN